VRGAAVALLSIFGTIFILGACSRDADERKIHDDVDILTSQEGQLAEDAANRLAKNYGVRAIPSIETAMHTANPPGRLNCIMALRRIGHPDAIPLLRHRAIYDEEEGVRKEAEITLRQWAGGTDDRANKARTALRAIEEAQHEEHKG
jgi:HEAT repeat protein